MAARIKMPLGMEVALGTGDFVLDGDPVPPGAPQFSAQVYRGKTAGWIKMVLGTEVGLSPGDVMLDGDPVLLPKKGAVPPFSAHFYCGQMAGCIKMPLGIEVGLSQETLYYLGTQPPPQKGAEP